MRPILERAKPTDIKIAEIFGQFDAVELTPDVMEQLARQGWQHETLQQAQKDGHRYLPSRNTMLMKPMSSDDEDFEDSETGED